MKNILVTGSNGQLGNEFRVLQLQFPQYQFIFTDVAELDITDFEAVNTFFTQNNIQIAINCAAYTQVDKAETDRELALKINAIGPQNLAQAAKANNALLVHVSTDYVFDGKGARPYRETDAVNPQGYYGITKLEGEKAVCSSGARALVVRTAWLYSSFGNNFVKTMRKIGAEKGALRVVADQYGTPTYAANLALAILTMTENYSGNGCEIYHYSNSGETTWYDFAVEILRLSNIPCQTTPITTAEYPTPTARPAYSVLDKSKIINDFGINIPAWEESLAKCINLL